MRQATHSVMLTILCASRSNSGLWDAIGRSMTPALRRDLVHNILMLPITYLSSMALWPSASTLIELAALPAEFFSLLCCLALEQLDGHCVIEAAVATAQAPVASKVPAPDPGQQTTLPSNRLGIVYLTCCPSSLITRVANTADRYVFVSPAVIQLYKRSLLLLGSGLGKFDSGHLAVLHNLLSYGLTLNARVHACSTKFHQVSGEPTLTSTHLLPVYMRVRATPVSDVQIPAGPIRTQGARRHTAGNEVRSSCSDCVQLDGGALRQPALPFAV